MGEKGDDASPDQRGGSGGRRGFDAIHRWEGGARARRRVPVCPQVDVTGRRIDDGLRVRDLFFFFLAANAGSETLSQRREYTLRGTARNRIKVGCGSPRFVLFDDFRLPVTAIRLLCAICIH